MRDLKALWLVCALLFAGGILRADQKTLIYVGPQLRDGYVDIDAGIVDSIKDIQDELRHSALFTLAPTPAKATIILVIVGRRTAGDNGSVGIPIGTSAIFLPIHHRAIDSVLHAGTYEKAITSEDDHSEQWRAAARRVVKDVTAWLIANRAIVLPAR
jgi:hypothetical protein